MLSMYSAIYLEVNLIAVILTVMILLRLYRDRDRQITTNAFRSVAVSILLILICECVWPFIDGRDTEIMTVLNTAVNVLYMSLTGVITCLWLRYVIYKLDKEMYKKKITDVLLLLPVSVLIIASAISPLTGFLFDIGVGNVYHRGPFYLLQPLISYLYFAVSAVFSIVIAARENDDEKKSDARTLLFFVLLPLAGSIISIVSGGLPTVWPFTSIGIVIVYINLQNRLISTDSLTGLNNRHQFDKYMRKQVPERRKDSTLYLYLADIDSFKMINDTMGHPVGDSALEQTAAILRATCDSRDTFIARYGGDEFAIFYQARSESEATGLMADINKAFELYNETGKSQYPLSVSIGMAALSGDIVTAEQLLEQADIMLYDMKARKRLSR